MTSILLLDIDGVLQFPRPEFAAAIERDYRWRHGYLAFQDDLFRDPAYLRSLAGDGDFLDVADRVLAEHVDGLTGSVFLDRWLGGNIQLNQALLDVIPRLGIERVYLASNQESRRGAYVEQLYRGQRWLAGAFLSHRVGHRKPDTRYFDHILRTVDRAPAECLFVDDNAACVAAATTVGINGIRFVDNRSLMSELASLGLIL
ncbi:HAD family hydrolase [Micromonospora sp. NPDC050417]|uniref:HAD family hydrolase n=1 Tax=Micromonospora sp. NPDC050417 TaxID=3364280 RepID=UPI0037AF4416